MQVSVRRFLLMFLLGRGRLARRLGLARLRLRPWLRLLLCWSGGVVFWCRGTRLGGLAGLRFGFNVLRRRRVLFRRMGRRSGLCSWRVVGPGSILGWPLLLLSVLRRMSDIGLLNRLLIVLRWTRRRVGVVCRVGSRPGWGW